MKTYREAPTREARCFVLSIGLHSDDIGNLFSVDSRWFAVNRPSGGFFVIHTLLTIDEMEQRLRPSPGQRRPYTLLEVDIRAVRGHSLIVPYIEKEVVNG